MYYEPPTMTLPMALRRLAVSVIAIAVGVLVSPTIAIVALAISTLVLLYCAAGSRAAQQRIPDLGRIPGVADHRLYELVGGKKTLPRPRGSKSKSRSAIGVIDAPLSISRAELELINELTRLGLRGLTLQGRLDTKNYMLRDGAAATVQSLDLEVRSWATAARSVLVADAPEFVVAFDAGPDLPPHPFVFEPKIPPVGATTDQLSVFLARKLRNLQCIKEELQEGRHAG